MLGDMAKGGPSKAQRLAQIPDLLRRKPRTTAELSERFGIPVRSIQRDLEHLRKMGEGIEEIKRGLYVLPETQATLNAVEALAVHAAARLLYHHAPTRNTHYQTALEKLASMLPEPARQISLDSLESVRQRPRDDRTLELVARSWFEGKVLAFEYRSATGSGQWRKKELEVYFIEVNRTNLALYAIGYERGFHERILTFKLARMRNLRLLNESFTIPEDFDPRSYLSNAWGIMGSQTPTRISLRFSPSAAARIREGGYPNLREERTLEDGSVEVSITAGADAEGLPLEVLSWVLSWGSMVEVLEPRALRKRWLEEIRKMVQFDTPQAAGLPAN